jgi:hypothetical protein
MEKRNKSQQSLLLTEDRTHPDLGDLLLHKDGMKSIDFYALIEPLGPGHSEESSTDL